MVSGPAKRSDDKIKEETSLFCFRSLRSLNQNREVCLLWYAVRSNQRAFMRDSRYIRFVRWQDLLLYRGV